LISGEIEKPIEKKELKEEAGGMNCGLFAMSWEL
jgi:hypothetical protein